MVDVPKEYLEERGRRKRKKKEEDHAREPDLVRDHGDLCHLVVEGELLHLGKVNSLGDH